MALTYRVGLTDTPLRNVAYAPLRPHSRKVSPERQFILRKRN
jgi:hypothetical protein